MGVQVKNWDGGLNMYKKSARLCNAMVRNVREVGRKAKPTISLIEGPFQSHWECEGTIKKAVYGCFAVEKLLPWSHIFSGCVIQMLAQVRIVFLQPC